MSFTISLEIIRNQSSEQQQQHSICVKKESKDYYIKYHKANFEINQLQLKTIVSNTSLDTNTMTKLQAQPYLDNKKIIMP